MERDVGDLGEDKFAGLCSAVGIIATAPKRDKNGWDFFLEFPKNIDNSKSLDSQSTQLTCRVQIKSTDIINNSQVQIGLSAILKLVEAQIPTFICFLNFDGMEEPQEVFLVHIDEKIIAKVLKKVRKCEHKNKQINKSTIVVKYDKSHKIYNISGLNLKNEIKKFIPNGMNSYINQKYTI